MRAQCPTPLEGPLELSVTFYFKRPQSWLKARRDAVDDGETPWYMGKPDLDNLVKLVKDAGNGILWRDDAQVVRLDADKVYGPENETIINVFTAKE
jgi:Holliday junction resolvase RusA-like endonuclease